MSFEEAVCIVSINSDETFTLNEDALAGILKNKEIDDHKVVILSIFGTYRKGKSFVMNFFLRYLQNTYNSHKENWLGGENEPLKGFRWRGGIMKETSGIMMWPEPFLVTQSNGDKIAIFLVDTQGAFDGESTNKIFAAIFAISTMISSIQIYNLTQNIQEDDLQNLQMLLEYSKIGVNAEDAPPFHKLVYLVRDWGAPYEAAFGFEGGAIVLKKKLEVKPEQPQELQSIRKDLKTSFKDVDCFLMTHPGFEASEKQTFEGRLSELRPEFKNCLKELIPGLLSAEKLECKKTNGLDLKVSNLPQFLKNYVELLNSSSISEATTIFEAQVTLQNLSALNSAKNFYDLAIEGGQSGITSITDLDGKHINFKNQALAKFDTQPKIGSKDVATTYRTKLGENIETHYAPIRAKWEANFNRPPPSPPRSDSPDILKEIGDAITAPFQSLNNSIRDVFGW